jgi:hypothetical protein
VRELNLSKNRRAAHRQSDEMSERLGKTLSAKRLISSKPDRKSGGYFQGYSNHLKCDSLFVMAGHSRLKDGVASARLCPGHPRL